MITTTRSSTNSSKTFVLQLYSNNGVIEGKIDANSHGEETFPIDETTTVGDLVEEACSRLEFSVQMASHFGIVTDSSKGQPLPADIYITDLEPKGDNCKGKVEGYETDRHTRHWLRLIYIPHIDHILHRVDDVTAYGNLRHLDVNAFNYFYRQIHWDLLHGDGTKHLKKSQSNDSVLGLCMVNMSIQVREAKIQTENLKREDCIKFIPRDILYLKDKDVSRVDKFFDLIPRRRKNLVRKFLSYVRKQTSNWSTRSIELQKMNFIWHVLKSFPQYGHIEYECSLSVECLDLMSTDIPGQEMITKPGVVTVFPPTHSQFGLVWLSDPKEAADGMTVHMSSITVIAMQEYNLQAHVRRSDSAPSFKLVFPDGSREKLKSLMSVLNIYYRLYVGWSRTLCTYNTARIHNLMCASIHPPAKFDWVCETLKRSNDVGNPFSCVVTQHETRVDHYVLYARRSIRYESSCLEPPACSVSHTSDDALATVQHQQQEIVHSGRTASVHNQTTPPAVECMAGVHNQAPSAGTAGSQKQAHSTTGSQTQTHTTNNAGPQSQANSTARPQNQSNSRTGSQNQTNNTAGPQNQTNSTVVPQDQPNSTAGSQNQTNSTAGPQNQTNSTVGPENQTNSTAGPQNQTNSTAGSQNLPNSTAGSQDQPNSTAGPQNQTNSTAGLQDQPNSTAGPQNQTNRTAGPQDQPNSTAGPQNQTNSTAGPQDQPNSTAGPQDQPNSTAGPQDQPNSTAGSQDQPNRTAGSQDQPNSTAGPQNQTNSTVGPQNLPNSTVEPKNQVKSTARPQGQTDRSDTAGPQTQTDSTDEINSSSCFFFGEEYEDMYADGGITVVRESHDIVAEVMTARKGTTVRPTSSDLPLQRNMEAALNIYYMFPHNLDDNDEGKKQRSWRLYKAVRDPQSGVVKRLDTPVICTLSHNSPYVLLRHLQEKHGFAKSVDYRAISAEGSGILLAAPLAAKPNSVPEQQGFFTLQAPRHVKKNLFARSTYTSLYLVELSIPRSYGISDRLSSKMKQELQEHEVDSSISENDEEIQIVKWRKREMLWKSVESFENLDMIKKAKQCLRNVTDGSSSWRHVTLVQTYGLIGDSSVVIEPIETLPRGLLGDNTALKSVSWMIRHDALTIKHKLQILFQIAQALSYITGNTHGGHTVHGNITSWNIYVTHYLPDTITVKLGDPGLAAFYLTLEQSEQEVKKRFHYYPPEYRMHWKDDLMLSTDADIYAFGVLAIELFFPETDVTDISRCIDDGLEFTSDSVLTNKIGFKERLRSELIFPCVRGRIDLKSIQFTLSLIAMDSDTTFSFPKPSRYYSYPDYKKEIQDKPANPLEKYRNSKLDVFRVKINDTPIAQGSFGKVYRGKYNGRDVAVKEPKIERRGTRLNMRVVEADMMKEMNWLTESRHPNIVEIIGYYQKNQNFYLVMELMETSCLKFFRKILPERLSAIQCDVEKMRHVQARTVSVCCDVANALQFIHSKRILHLDLAPRNVLFQSNGPSKLGDFGLSRQVDETGAVLGNWTGPLTIYPLEVKETLTFRYSTDIWSFGLLIRDFLFSCPEQEYKNFFETLRINIETRSRTRSMPFDCPEHVDTQLEMVMLSCLRPVRPRSAEATTETDVSTSNASGIQQLLRQSGPRPSAVLLRKKLEELKHQAIFKVDPSY